MYIIIDQIWNVIYFSRIGNGASDYIFLAISDTFPSHNPLQRFLVAKKSKLNSTSLHSHKYYYKDHDYFIHHYFLGLTILNDTY